ncbi:hypothetical protein CSAL01_13071 [Colletotrichum salicis]|uniref:Uncharacterized protein n=1 Tax=Colletotrichum salicis TaxID=1209931 RepID=A0A135UUE0_9PEZI|nr:hypothetical protein CSAL01_13071 [Colletotrichum salicis]
MLHSAEPRIVPNNEVPQGSESHGVVGCSRSPVSSTYHATAAGALSSAVCLRIHASSQASSHVKRRPAVARSDASGTNRLGPAWMNTLPPLHLDCVEAAGLDNRGLLHVLRTTTSVSLRQKVDFHFAPCSRLCPRPASPLHKYGKSGGHSIPSHPDLVPMG